MKKQVYKNIMSIPIYEKALDEYRDSSDFKQAYENLGCDGLEIIVCDEDQRSIVKNNMVIGLHMIFYCSWFDFWINDKQRLIAEFGSQKVWNSIFGGSTFDSVIKKYKEDLDYANQIGAEYVVFHVSEVTIEEVFTHKYNHTDEEVVDACCKIINSILDGKNYNFYFLMENLWWPGFNFRNERITKRLLDGVHYKKKGIMLDIGHLLCSNTDIENEKEGCNYIHEILTKHEKLIPDFPKYVKGIHLHKSITGKYVKQALCNIPVLEKEYLERFRQVYEHLAKVDTHEPWDTNEICSVIDRIKPDYLVHEVIAQNREERERKIKVQINLQSSKD